MSSVGADQPALPPLLVAAWTCGANPMIQVVASGRRQPVLRRVLGFMNPTSLSGSTCTRLFEVRSFGALREAVGEVVRGTGAAPAEGVGG
jgi:hypothetical protein